MACLVNGLYTLPNMGEIWTQREGVRDTWLAEDSTQLEEPKLWNKGNGKQLNYLAAVNSELTWKEVRAELKTEVWEKENGRREHKLVNRNLLSLSSFFLKIISP